jgi:hypothetical protein
MDPDMLCLCDIRQLQDLFDPTYAVQVVQHQYTPRKEYKHVGGVEHEQHVYARKNWSSLIIFNNERCRDIYTKQVIDTTPGLTLNTFGNVPDELIGSIPKPFNYLVGEDNQEGPARIVHFTNGTPTGDGPQDCEFATEWNDELHEALHFNYTR